MREWKGSRRSGQILINGLTTAEDNIKVGVIRHELEEERP